MRNSLHSAWMAAVGILCVSAVGCEMLVDTGPTGDTQVEVSLVNDADEAVHILTSEEDFANGNRVPSGAARSVFVRGPGESLVQFRAGRNGTVLATVQCRLVRDRDGEDPGLRVVVYHEPAGVGSLVCVNWS